MFKQCVRSFFTAVLLVVLAGSSALAATSIRSATPRAQLSSSDLARVARRARRKPGTVIHQRKSRNAIAASTVLLGDDVVESQSDFLAAGRAEAASSLTLSPADVGGTVRNVVTAANEGGANSAASEPSELIAPPPPPPPTNTVAPTVSGTAQVGDTLTATEGSWTESPTSFAYQWEDCNTAGKSCSDISGATGAAYKLAVSDAGHTLRVVVTAGNEGGANSVASEASQTVAPEPPPPAPTNTVLPAVSGSTVEGQTLSASTGAWLGSPTSFSYQWEDCNTSGGACVNVSDATSSTYKLAASDVGHTLRMAVAADRQPGPAALTWSKALDSAIAWPALHGRPLASRAIQLRRCCPPARAMRNPGRETKQ